MSELIFGDTPPASVELGANVERCRQCSFELAEDQRYCVNCGTRRAEPRVDYKSLLADGGAQAAPATSPVPAPLAPVAPAAVAAETRAVTPLGAAVALGLVLLSVLLGAVIGKGSADSSKPVMVGPPATTAPSTQAVAAPGTTQAAEPAPKSNPSSGSSDTQAKNSAVTKALSNSSGNAYSEKSSELKGLMSTGN